MSSTGSLRWVRVGARLDRERAATLSRKETTTMRRFSPPFMLAVMLIAGCGGALTGQTPAASGTSLGASGGPEILPLLINSDRLDDAPWVQP
ncbi:MAG: hypothetical protein M0Z49_09675 [Chloroflexi bacterium]|nr:hypothetical protein [Chloroflexota bacterium]